MKYLPVIIAFLLASCVSQQKIMDSWMGHHKSELIQNWGPPSSTASDGQGGEVLIYSKISRLPAQGIYGDNGQYHQTAPARTIRQDKMMYVDASGKIYHWRTEVNDVPPQQVDVTITNGR